jgi:hypothetical protein
VMALGRLSVPLPFDRGEVPKAGHGIKAAHYSSRIRAGFLSRGKLRTHRYAGVGEAVIKTPKSSPPPRREIQGDSPRE